MPTISMFYGIVIQMYWSDHNPAHFHALYGEFEILINIQTLEVIQGKMPKRALILIMEWALDHRDELLEDWNLCTQNKMPNKILPLE